MNSTRSCTNRTREEIPNFVFDGYELFMTSWMCPEQYDVFKDGVQVGYLRLRNGWFSARTPNNAGNTVYEAHPSGDGGFDADERERYLAEAVRAIARSYSNNPRTP